jgi:hypothetical protein
MATMSGDQRSERGALAQGIPSTQFITDPDVKRPVDALVQSVEYLLNKVKALEDSNAALTANLNSKNSLPNQGAASSADSLKLVAGRNITLDTLSGGATRINAPGAGMAGRDGIPGPAGADAALPTGSEGQVLMYSGGAWTAVTPTLRKVIHTLTYSEDTKSLITGWTNMYVLGITTSGGDTVFTAVEC